MGSQPRFSGRFDDWFGFCQDWERYKGFMSLYFGGNEIPDAILLEALGKCLDDASQKLLQQHREGKPDLRFGEFWGILQDEFSSDSTHQHRNAWHRVRLI